MVFYFHNMQILIYPASGKFNGVFTPYLNLINYVVKKIQVTYYHLNTGLCCYGCCQGLAASLIYILMKLSERVELGVTHTQK